MWVKRCGPMLKQSPTQIVAWETTQEERNELRVLICQPSFNSLSVLLLNSVQTTNERAYGDRGVNRSEQSLVLRDPVMIQRILIIYYHPSTISNHFVQETEVSYLKSKVMNRHAELLRSGFFQRMQFVSSSLLESKRREPCSVKISDEER